MRQKMSFNNSDITDLLHGFLVINLSAVEDLADVELVENFTEFGLDAVVHSEDEAEVGEFDEDSEDSDDSD
ncbi:hypothetical protein F2Q69_00054944 [Brassica cretica]|uniref:Uncharacterized protein n=1 Tax=Brassica cretica TaxID=69181 RepID=A0A8S9N0S4_BRACR|nr:hypothetical protein F2Q69_00054944 [Brassica cretica]